LCALLDTVPGAARTLADAGVAVDLFKLPLWRAALGHQASRYASLLARSTIACSIDR